MKRIQLLLIMLFAVTFASAQTLEELRSMKAEKSGQIADLQSQIDAINGDIGGLDAQIKELTGWETGYGGMVGFDLTNSNNWIANPNPNATSSALNIGLTAFANNDKAKRFWNNKAIVQKAWQDIDTSEEDATGSDDGLFDNGTVDIFNLSSLAGYKLSEKFALSGMGELNTSIENFLKPGTADLGLGATWLPIPGMTVVVHPLNYRLAWPADESGFESTGGLGAKLRADYARDLMIAGRKIAWNSTFTSFIPYQSAKEGEAKLNEYTWLNTLAFEVWRGIGVGVGFGVRKADFETTKTQSFTNLGLTYNL